MRKTTVVINERLLEDAMKVTGARTKKEAIEAGLQTLVKQRNRQLLSEELGTYDLELTPEELERLRDER